MERVSESHLLQLVVEHTLALQFLDLKLLGLDHHGLSRDLHDEGQEHDNEGSGEEESVEGVGGGAGCIKIINPPR